MEPESKSLATLPKMSGMTIKNENLAALDLSTLSNTAVAIVAPDLDIQQRPPVFSALKKEGKRLYEYARAGESVEIPTRQVSVHSFTIAPKTFPTIAFEVVCSKGTYIRSLAHDYGKALKSGAHLSSLRRTKIGDFNVNNAIDAASFKDLLEKNTAP